MLSMRQNLIETINGGNPDRFVNQFEAIEFISGAPYSRNNNMSLATLKPGDSYINGWGVTICFKESAPAPFPLHDDEHKVLKDITDWEKVVHAPDLNFDETEWDLCKQEFNAVDHENKFATVTLAPGIFEQLHYLMGMSDCLENFYFEPEAVKELIEYITEWELNYARLLCDHFCPDAIIHHDDWGSQKSTFLSPEMFEEFIFPSTKKLYSYYKNRGVQLIIHHSDSYAETLVPDMIDMGIDIWQGCLDTNDIPELIKKYGGSISFMGGINNGVVDVKDWTTKGISDYVEKTCLSCGKHYFIPSCTAGGPVTIYPGVFEEVTKQIDRMSSIMFK